jgi:hypothetical protein
MPVMLRFARLSASALVAIQACAPSSRPRAPETATTPASHSRPTAAPGSLSSVNLPRAKNAQPILDKSFGVPIVTVANGKIYRDGELVGNAESIARSGRLQRVEELWNSLKTAREQWKLTNPGKPFHGLALFALDSNTPTVVVKSVFQTAAFAGFPNGQFAVHGDDGSIQRLDVEAQVPGPPVPEASLKNIRPLLLLTVQRSKLLLAWRHGESARDTVTIASVGELPDEVQRQWDALGTHRDATDPAFDHAILYVSHDIDYAGTVVVIDALHATKRGVARIKERVPALTVSLAMASENTGEEATRVNGRLAPETIQRIVRENFDHFRGCYERGLAKNSALSGKLNIRFVIERSGKVGTVGDGGESTLADPSAVKCIFEEFAKLSFPQPDGGTVTVVYPIVFNPE